MRLKLQSYDSEDSYFIERVFLAQGIHNSIVQQLFSDSGLQTSGNAFHSVKESIMILCDNSFVIAAVFTLFVVDKDDVPICRCADVLMC